MLNAHAKGVVATYSWQPPRRWCNGEFALPPMEGTGPGTLRLWTEDLTQLAECRYPLEPSWLIMSREAWSAARAHSRDIVRLGLVLGVVLGGPTNLHEMMYESDECLGWHPMLARMPRTLWDYSGPPSDMVSNPELAELLNGLPPSEDGVLRLLGQAVNIGNPVARYLCIWQALAFHIGTDTPSQVDNKFFDRIGIPRDCPHGKDGETKYTQFRNMLSHPKGRDVPDYDALDARARDLADDLARLLVTDMLGSAVGLTSAST